MYLEQFFISSTHDYDTIDDFPIDTRLGTDDEFAKFPAAYASSSMEFLNRLGREFWRFREALSGGDKSITWRWFEGLKSARAPRMAYAVSRIERSQDARQARAGKSRYAQSYVCPVDSWIDRFEFNGIRLDAIDCLSTDFIRALRRHADARRPHFYLMGKAIRGDYRAWANAEMCDDTANYEAYRPSALRVTATFSSKWPARSADNPSIREFTGRKPRCRTAGVKALQQTRCIDDLCDDVFYAGDSVDILWRRMEHARQKVTGYETDLEIRPAIALGDLTTDNAAQADAAKGDLRSAMMRFAKARRHNDDIMPREYAPIETAPQRLLLRCRYCRRTGNLCRYAQRK